MTTAGPRRFFDAGLPPTTRRTWSSTSLLASSARSAVRRGRGDERLPTEILLLPPTENRGNDLDPPHPLRVPRRGGLPRTGGRYPRPRRRACDLSRPTAVRMGPAA